MPEFFLELFSEEIPARMQRDAAQGLYNICNGVCQGMEPTNIRVFYGPRRLAVSADIRSEKPSGIIVARGPRTSAPEGALNGFLNKHSASHDELTVEDGYFVFRRNMPAVSAMKAILETLPATLAIFSWPKSMRWGQSGSFTWIRPLRRVTCLLDGKVIPFTLGPIKTGSTTEGHRFLAPAPFDISGSADWVEKLRHRWVMPDADERKEAIRRGLNERASNAGLTVLNDDGLLDEVTGLVEWPFPLIGRIDQDFMDLPWEVRELSMKVNQKYFALRDVTGGSAPYFAFVSNIDAKDGGKAIIAGNERVLRARLSDARHFWELDLKTPLPSYLPKLERITFHAKLGTQLERIQRLEVLAKQIANLLNGDGEEERQAGLAARLCKADLVTGMVGEFPELQGVMGGYYAERYLLRAASGPTIGKAIRTHYLPKGPSDPVPQGICAISVALADKIDTLVGFFGAEEVPTGSRDPYALRRAALGVARIIRENNLRIRLIPLFRSAHDEYLSRGIQLTDTSGYYKAFKFVADRLEVQLRAEGKRHDLVTAVFNASEPDDLNFLVERAEALENFLSTKSGQDLLAAYRRLSNILVSELPKEVDLSGSVDPEKFLQEEERLLFGPLQVILDALPIWFGETRQINAAMTAFASLRDPVDAFFENVTVNATDAELRRNRLRLLAKLRLTMHQIADFSKIEG